MDARPHARGTALLLATLAACAAPHDAQATRFEFTATHMGTGWRLVLHASDASRARVAADAAFARIAALDATLSDWDPDSELSRAPRDGAGTVAVSDDLAAVLREAHAIAALTGGAFDVTVGPIVRLWRRAVRQQELPSPPRLADALARVGWQHVTVEGSAVTFAIPGIQLDAGGIAKGYAAREALRVLAEHGIPSALVDGGGDLALGAPPPGRDGWDVGLVPLTEGDTGSGALVTLHDCGIATSGDAFRFVELDGVRYSHIVDPRTGLGLTTRISVTAIHPDPARADAFGCSK